MQGENNLISKFKKNQMKQLQGAKKKLGIRF